MKATPVTLRGREARLAIGQFMKGQRRSKFGNNRTQSADGIKHVSAKQARRWAELRLLLQSGDISDLRREVPYDLTVNGEHICIYRADHVYTQDGAEVVEDVKSEITAINPVYLLKRRLMKAIYKIEVREV